jgi:1-deoxy-D-xylulose-5-phosphate reductoisomerase
VAAFLDRRITFLDIPRVVRETLERMDRVPDKTHNDSDAVESARNTDAEARRMADEVVSGQFAA